MKRIETIDIPGNEDGSELVVGRALGMEPGPVTAVIGGVHGTEYAAHTGVLQFWDRLDPTSMTGEVRVVLVADILAAINHSPFRNPVDGKNLNRVWPGKRDGTYTERLAFEITEHVINGSDFVVDVHSGEWDQDIKMWAFTHTFGDPEQESRCLELARATGVPFVEVTDARSEPLGLGTLSGEAAKAGSAAVTIEAGGRADPDSEIVRQIGLSLANVLRHTGNRPGLPRPWGGGTTIVSNAQHLYSSEQGRFERMVEVGEWVEAGQPIATVFATDGAQKETISTPVEGTILYMMRSMWTSAGRFVAKVAGMEFATRDSSP